MKKRIISLALAMAMCFALGITSFAVEPPTLHQTMMELLPGYETTADGWTNWTPFQEVRSNKIFTTFTMNAIKTFLSNLTGIPKTIWDTTDAAWEIYDGGHTQVWYTYRYKTRVNDTTMELQQYFSIAVYADSARTELIYLVNDTATYPYQLNSVPDVPVLN